MSTKILILEGITDKGLEILKAEGWTLDMKKAMPPAELAKMSDEPHTFMADSEVKTRVNRNAVLAWMLAGLDMFNEEGECGTGAVVPTDALAEEVAKRFADPRVAYLHVRSARNNCFQVRIDRD